MNTLAISAISVVCGALTTILLLRIAYARKAKRDIEKSTLKLELKIPLDLVSSVREGYISQVCNADQDRILLFSSDSKELPAIGVDICQKKFKSYITYDLSEIIPTGNWNQFIIEVLEHLKLIDYKEHMLLWMIQSISQISKLSVAPQPQGAVASPSGSLQNNLESISILCKENQVAILLYNANIQDLGRSNTGSNFLIQLVGSLKAVIVCCNHYETATELTSNSNITQLTVPPLDYLGFARYLQYDLWQISKTGFVKYFKENFKVRQLPRKKDERKVIDQTLELANKKLTYDLYSIADGSTKEIEYFLGALKDSPADHLHVVERNQIQAYLEEKFIENVVGLPDQSIELLGLLSAARIALSEKSLFYFCGGSETNFMEAIKPLRKASLVHRTDPDHYCNLALEVLALKRQYPKAAYAHLNKAAELELDSEDQFQLYLNMESLTSEMLSVESARHRFLEDIGYFAFALHYPYIARHEMINLEESVTKYRTAVEENAAHLPHWDLLYAQMLEISTLSKRKASSAEGPDLKDIYWTFRRLDIERPITQEKINYIRERTNKEPTYYNIDSNITPQVLDEYFRIIDELREAQKNTENRFNLTYRYRMFRKAGTITASQGWLDGMQGAWVSSAMDFYQPDPVISPAEQTDVEFHF